MWDGDGNSEGANRKRVGGRAVEGMVRQGSGGKEPEEGVGRRSEGKEGKEWDAVLHKTVKRPQDIPIPNHRPLIPDRWGRDVEILPRDAVEDTDDDKLRQPCIATLKESVNVIFEMKKTTGPPDRS